MGVETVAGTELSISAAAPATFNAAGYAALDWIEVGEITDGGSHGRTYAVVNHNPIKTRGTQKLKGSFNDGQKTLQLALDDDDAGQTILKEALNSDADYSFQVQYQGGAVDYFQAKVVSWVKAAAGVDSMLSATVGLEITTSKDGIGVIEA